MCEAVLVHEGVWPDILQQFIVRQNPSGILDQIQEYIEGPAVERENVAFSPQNASQGIDLKLAELKYLLRFHRFRGDSEPVRACQKASLAFLEVRRYVRDMNDRDRVYRLYQWLSRRARFFRSDSAIGGLSRTVRTEVEVTFQRRGTTLLVGGAPADLDRCPLCGQKLAPAQAEQSGLLLQADSTIHPLLPADRDPL